MVRVTCASKQRDMAFNVLMYSQQSRKILCADSKGPDQPALMRRLIRAFAIRPHEDPFPTESLIVADIEKSLFNHL